MLAARILIKLSENISKFPAHVIQIQTSTVFECMDAGLTKAAYDISMLLMRPEYRNKLDPKHRKKIESVVRKYEATIDVDEEVSPCPKCSAMMTITSLDCLNCKNIIPYCIVTVIG